MQSSLNIEEIYNIFMTEEYEVFKNKMDTIYFSHGFSYIKKLLKNYAYDIGKGKEFEQRNLFQIKFIKYIDRIVHNDQDIDWKDLSKRLKTNDMQKNLDKYFKAFPENEDKRQFVEEVLITRVYSKKIPRGNKKSYSEESNYLKIFNHLLSLSDEEVIMQLKKYHFKESEYEMMLRRYQKRFPNNKEQLEKLKNMYNEYLNYFNLNKTKDDKVREYYEERIKNFLDSNLTSKEYCSSEFLRFREFKNLGAEIQNSNPELYRKFKNAINIESEEFDQNIDEIIIKMLNNENFDLFDYYYMTGIALDNFQTLCEKKLTEEDLIKIKKIVKNLKKIDNNILDIPKEKILESKIIISNKEITSEEKKLVFEFLDNNNMPRKLFQIALRKYCNNDERFNMKKIENKEKIYKNIINKMKKLSKFELVDYMNQKLEQMHFYNIDYLFKVLNKVANKEDKEIIEIKKKEYKYFIREDAKIIYKFLHENPNDFTDLLLYSSKETVINCLKNYKKYYIEDQDKIDDILNNPDKYFKMYTPKIKEVIELMLSKSKKTDYLEVAYKLLTSSKEEAINYLRRKNYSKEQFTEKVLKKFKNRFPNQPEYEILVERFNEYENLVKKNHNIREDYYEKIIDELLYSDLTIEEFCSQTGKSISEYKKICNKLKYHEKVKIIESRSNINFDKKMKSLCYEIINNLDFDMVVYYSYTKLKIDEFLRIAKKYFADEKLFIKMTIILRKSSRKLNMNINKEQEINGRRIINGTEITKEEKEKIFNYIEENNYPLSVYTMILKKYLNNEIDLGLQKTLKK